MVYTAAGGEYPPCGSFMQGEECFPMVSPIADGPEFDGMAEDYEAEIAPYATFTGERREYFTHARFVWMARRFKRRGIHARRVVDFGCGTGTCTPLFFELLGAESVLGVDVSPRSLAVAERAHGSARARFALRDDYTPDASADLVFSTGVFHHIPPAERPDALDYVMRCLKPGGLFALWENNIWNPAVRYNMGRAAIDRHAIPLAPPTARRLVRAAGFSLLATDFLFFFPGVLRPLQRLEPLLRAVPIGGGYLVLAAKPGGDVRASR